MPNSRTLNSVINGTSGVLLYALSSVMNFAVRTVFIRILGQEYLGLNGLLLSIISAFSIAEMGISSAIVCVMYKPIADNDFYRVSGLVNYLRKAYRLIALVVLLIGLCVAPFIRTIVGNQYNGDNLYLIYTLFVISSVSSYMFAYKNSILIASQKSYIINLYSFFISFVIYVLQALVLLLFSNYILYLIIRITVDVVGRYIIGRKADKLFPEVFGSGRIDTADKHSVMSYTKALLVHRVGSVIVNSTDNILISAYVDLATVGSYSNYLMITSMIIAVSNRVFAGTVASYGNLAVCASEDKKLDVFWTLFFIASIMFGFFAVCCYVFFTPFILCWVGPTYLLNDTTKLIICLNLYAAGMRKPYASVSEAMGIFKFDQYKPLLEAAVNLISSVLLARKFGIAGILFGTLISTIFVDMIIEPINLFKNGLTGNKMKNLTSYYLRLLQYVVILAVSFVLIRFVSNMVSSIILKIAIVTSIYFGIIILAFNKSREYEIVLTTIKKYVGRRKENI